MAASSTGSMHNDFLVTPQAAVDLANHTAVASVDTDIAVQTVDGADLFPLKANDVIVPVKGFQALEAGIAIVSCIYKDSATLTLRTTNPSAGAINPASIAAAGILFKVSRR
jgi:hypothetical protein